MGPPSLLQKKKKHHLILLAVVRGLCGLANTARRTYYGTISRVFRSWNLTGHLGQEVKIKGLHTLPS